MPRPVVASYGRRQPHISAFRHSLAPVFRGELAYEYFFKVSAIV